MIPLFEIEVGQFVFDGEAYATDVKKATTAALRAATQAFLAAADTRIPTRTGFLRGAFHILGQGNPINPVNTRPEYYYPNPVGREGQKKGVHRGGAILKTPTSGQQLTAGGVTSTPDPLGWKFQFSVDIRYLAFNDVKYGWDSWRQAIIAFQKTFSDEIVYRLPNITSYLRIVKATVPSQVSPQLESIDITSVVD